MHADFPDLFGAPLETGRLLQTADPPRKPLPVCRGVGQGAFGSCKASSASRRGQLAAAPQRRAAADPAAAPAVAARVSISGELLIIVTTVPVEDRRSLRGARHLKRDLEGIQQQISDGRTCSSGRHHSCRTPTSPSGFCGARAACRCCRAASSRSAATRSRLETTFATSIALLGRLLRARLPRQRAEGRRDARGERDDHARRPRPRARLTRGARQRRSSSRAASRTARRARWRRRSSAPPRAAVLGVVMGGGSEGGEGDETTVWAFVSARPFFGQVPPDPLRRCAARAARRVASAAAARLPARERRDGEAGARDRQPRHSASARRSSPSAPSTTSRGSTARSSLRRAEVRGDRRAAGGGDAAAGRAVRRPRPPALRHEDGRVGRERVEALRRGERRAARDAAGLRERLRPRLHQAGDVRAVDPGRVPPRHRRISPYACLMRDTYQPALLDDRSCASSALPRRSKRASCPTSIGSAGRSMTLRRGDLQPRRRPRRPRKRRRTSPAPPFLRGDTDAFVDLASASAQSLLDHLPGGVPAHPDPRSAQGDRPLTARAPRARDVGVLHPPARQHRDPDSSATPRSSSRRDAVALGDSQRASFSAKAQEVKEALPELRKRCGGASRRCV